MKEGGPALKDAGPALDVHVEQVDLLVAPRDLAVLVDPEKRILDLFAPVRRVVVNAAGVIVRDVGGLVDADGDGEAGAAGLGADAEDEGGGVGGLGEADGGGGVGGDVVGCLGKEECLGVWMRTERGVFGSSFCAVVLRGDGTG